MEQLLDLADALVLTAGEELELERPDFDIPEEYHPFTTPYDFLQLLENPSKGKGWFAKRDIPAGSMLMVAKPIAMTLDWEWDASGNRDGNVGMRGGGAAGDASMDEDSENSAEPEDSQINELLLLQVLEAIKTNTSLWEDVVSSLYPRDPVDVQESPVWISKDDTLFMKFESIIQELDNIPQLNGKSKEISQRLPLIVRYNALSVETCPELLSYPGPTGHSCLSGVGLYHLPSFFNHDSRPNASRYAVGDVMWLIANQDIPMGSEVCISYLEHDILCESAFRRNLMLTLDFKEDEDADPKRVEEHDGPELPVVDDEVQNELMKMVPFERLEAIQELMSQASGESPHEGERTEEDGMETGGGGVWYQCDIQNCRILKAITLDSIGQSKQAIDVWEECVQFTETKMPPHDESIVVMRVQAALCAWKIKDKQRSHQHAAVALRIHQLLFGGGVNRFRRRYRNEFMLSLRSDEKDEIGRSPYEVLWPL